MSFLRRSLTETEIQAATQKAVETLRLMHLEEVQKGFSRVVKIPKQESVKFGKQQVMIPVGATLIGGRLRQLALKLSRAVASGETPTHIEVRTHETNYPSQDEGITHFLRKKGFPIPFHHVIGELGHELYGIITEYVENAQEANGFNFSTLANGRELKRSLNQLVDRLFAQVKSDTLALSGAHGGGKNELRKCFSVIVDQKKKTGRLLLTDVRNLDFYHSKRKDPHLMQAYKKTITIHYLGELSHNPNLKIDAYIRQHVNGLPGSKKYGQFIDQYRHLQSIRILRRLKSLKQRFQKIA